MEQRKRKRMERQVKRVLFSYLEIVPDEYTEQSGQISETNAKEIVSFHGKSTRILIELKEES